MKSIPDLRQPLVQFVKFNFVGIVNTAVDYVIFFVLYALGLSAFWAQFISYSCGMLNSYVMNRSWTFRSSGAFRRSTVFKFIGWNLLVLAAAQALLFLFAEMLGWPVWLAKLAATALTIVLNFAGSKYLVFNRGGSGE